jgi:Mor family transcriptional regulator
MGDRLGSQYLHRGPEELGGAGSGGDIVIQPAGTQREDPLRSYSQRHLPEMMRDWADHLALWLGEGGLPAEQATTLVMRLVERTMQHWSGVHLYVPRGIAWQCSQRDIDIYHRAEAQPYAIQDIALEHGISVAWVYQILARVRATLRTKEPDLFDDHA